LEKQTTPPSYFNDATLLAAMTGISAHVKDKALKKILKETDGLGTEATRAGIIELLFKRNFLCRSGKTIKATENGKALIGALPESTTLPDRTAHWESVLGNISQKKASYNSLMEPLVGELHNLTLESQSVIPVGLQSSSTKKWRSKRKYTKNKKLAPK